MKSVVCATGLDCSVDQGLANTIAEFKTPTLRDSRLSPYFHNGSKLKLEDVVEFYISSSALAQGAAEECSGGVAEYAALEGDLKRW